jgi:hypothetical protein
MSFNLAADVGQSGGTEIILLIPKEVQFINTQPRQKK